MIYLIIQLFFQNFLRPFVCGFGCIEHHILFWYMDCRRSAAHAETLIVSWTDIFSHLRRACSSVFPHISHTVIRHVLLTTFWGLLPMSFSNCSSKCRYHSSLVLILEKLFFFQVFWWLHILLCLCANLSHANAVLGSEKNLFLNTPFRLKIWL